MSDKVKLYKKLLHDAWTAHDEWLESDQWEYLDELETLCGSLEQCFKYYTAMARVIENNPELVDKELVLMEMEV